MVILPSLPILILLAWLAPAKAQEHHELGHLEYKNWVNAEGTGCCNNQDCGVLRDDQVRETENGVDVFVGFAGEPKKWCHVMAKHYVKKGKSPYWGAAHACVRAPYVDESGTATMDVCERLLCYMPKGGF